MSQQQSPCKTKAVLATGAASGVGLAAAKQFARAGADLCLVDIDAEGLERAAEEIRAQGVKALVQVVFLASAAECGYHGACVVIDKGMCAG